MELNRSLNMAESRNGQSQSKPDQPQPKPARYTAERVLRERPETYRKVALLLAEPREHVSYNQIKRICHVNFDTIKAIERNEAIPIGERKQALLKSAMRVAELSVERMEQLAPTANISQATIAFGVATEKMLLLSGENTANIHVTVDPGLNLYERFQQLHDQLQQPPKPKAIQVNVLPQSQDDPGEHSANSVAKP
jgi:hypothetical protein